MPRLRLLYGEAALIYVKQSVEEQKAAVAVGFEMVYSADVDAQKRALLDAGPDMPALLHHEGLATAIQNAFIDWLLRANSVIAD